MNTGDRESREAMRYAWVGTQFAIIVVAFAVGGFWLDRWLGTLPGFTVVFSVVGLVWALYNAGRDAIRFGRWLDAWRDGEDNPDSGDGQDHGNADR